MKIRLGASSLFPFTECLMALKEGSVEIAVAV